MKVKRTKKLWETCGKIKKLAKARIEAGWIDAGEKHADSNLTMAELAYLLEYGARVKVTPKMRGFFAVGGLKNEADEKSPVFLKKSTRFINIPPRPMLRMTARDCGKEWVKKAGQLSKAVLYDKMEADEAHKMLALQLEQDIKKTMANGNFAPNAPLTVKLKGKNTPLINTFGLLNAVRGEVK